MKKIIVICISLLLIGSILLNAQIIQAKSQEILYQSPCDMPKTYRIGAIDSQFALSEDEYRTAIQEAALIWEEAYGKQLFSYDPEGDLAMNLTYDDRQALNTEINQQNETLKEKDVDLEAKIAEHHRKVQDLHRRVAALNQEIESWNAKGGAPDDVYQDLNSRQQQLQQEGDALNKQANALSIDTEKYNTQVKQLDENVDEFNSALLVKPEGGVYVRNDEGEKIDIYIYNTRTELINIIAHELGHSLGVSHVEDENAIMYPKSNAVTALTPDDIAAMKVACKKQNVLVLKGSKILFAVRQQLLKYIAK